MEFFRIKTGRYTKEDLTSALRADSFHSPLKQGVRLQDRAHSYMVTTFKYRVSQRLFAIFIILPIALVSYGIIQDAFPLENFLYSFLCIIVSVSFGLFAIHILNEFWVKIVINYKGISVKKLYNSHSVKWVDIVEYGREQPFGYGRGNWRYYIKSMRYGDKKIKICHGKLKETRRLNAHIISKLDPSRLNNIGPGMME